jgi:hypothetical protein
VSITSSHGCASEMEAIATVANAIMDELRQRAMMRVSRVCPLQGEAASGVGPSTAGQCFALKRATPTTLFSDYPIGRIVQEKCSPTHFFDRAGQPESCNHARDLPS